MSGCGSERMKGVGKRVKAVRLRGGGVASDVVAGNGSDFAVLADGGGTVGKEGRMEEDFSDVEASVETEGVSAGSAAGKVWRQQPKIREADERDVHFSCCGAVILRALFLLVNPVG